MQNRKIMFLMTLLISIGAGTAYALVKDCDQELQDELSAVDRIEEKVCEAQSVLDEIKLNLGNAVTSDIGFPLPMLLESMLDQINACDDDVIEWLKKVYTVILNINNRLLGDTIVTDL